MEKFLILFLAPSVAAAVLAASSCFSNGRFFGLGKMNSIQASIAEEAGQASFLLSFGQRYFSSQFQYMHGQQYFHLLPSQIVQPLVEKSPFLSALGLGCYSHKWYEIFCNTAFSPPRLCTPSLSLEVLSISLQDSTINISLPVVSSGSSCDNAAALAAKVDMGKSPYAFSPKETDSLPQDMRIWPYYGKTLPMSAAACRLVDQQWFTCLKNLQAVYAMDYVPVVLDWWIDRSTFNFSEINHSWGFQSLRHAGISAGHPVPIVHCHCLADFTGNPYLPHGCQEQFSISEVDPCLKPDACRQYPGSVCRSFQGGYSCSLPGTVSVQHDKAHFKLVLLLSGVAIGIGILFFLLGLWKMHHGQKKSKEIKLKKHFFKRNGRLLLQQQLASGEANINKVRLFSSKDLAKATDNFSVNRMPGQGGQGTVYKGMLEDGRIAAVKRSRLVSEGKVESFINEVVILSQINRKNVVKLLGCCLETEVPLLVHEFIPNGTLSDYLHCPNDHEFLLTWEMRARIAAEVAGALSYLHSAASFPIYHRDIMTSNILLEDWCRAKVADFGISRTLAMGETHLTTQVQGTVGYLDPDYFQTSQFTEKSDVYSFGVVLVELLTGRDSLTCGEWGSLVKFFMISMEENRLEDIVDGQLMKQAGKAAVTAVAKLAESCLNINGKLRPTMKEATHELEKVSSISSLPFYA